MLQPLWWMQFGLRIKLERGVVMLDLRTPASYKKGHVPGAVYTNYSKDGWR